MRSLGFDVRLPAGPTLLALGMFPILLFVRAWLAIAEERDGERFGDHWRAHGARTSWFRPKFGGAHAETRSA